MTYWIFQANPKYYDFDERLKCDNPELTWLASRYVDEIGRDDVAFAFVCGKEPRIRAVLKVKHYPEEMDELPHELKYYKEPPVGIVMRVRATITNRNVSLSEALLRSTPGLEKLSILQGGRQGTNFKVTPAEARIINRLIEEQAGQRSAASQNNDFTA